MEITKNRGGQRGGQMILQLKTIVNQYVDFFSVDCSDGTSIIFGM